MSTNWALATGSRTRWSRTFATTSASAGSRHVKAHDCLGRGQGLAAEWLQVNLFEHQSTRHAFDDPPLPNRGRIKARATGERSSTLTRVGVFEQFDRIAPHQHTEVVLGFGNDAVGIDELELRIGLKRVQLVYVTVHQHGPHLVVRQLPPSRTGKIVVDDLD